jgi:hypothetical protein
MRGRSWAVRVSRYGTIAPVGKLTVTVNSSTLAQSHESIVPEKKSAFASSGLTRQAASLSGKVDQDDQFDKDAN